jgi:hypothetical protein
MRIEITEALWLDTRDPLTLTELARSSGLSPAILRTLIELEALPPADAAAATFGADCLDIARTAQRLRNDLELDTAALAVVLRLLGRIRSLETEMRALQAQLPRHLL